jgi:hypothetical protein
VERWDADGHTSCDKNCLARQIWNLCIDIECLPESKTKHDGIDIFEIIPSLELLLLWQMVSFLGIDGFAVG